MAVSEPSVEIVDIALPDGFGVGKKDGFVFFVPGAVPGDMVHITIRRESRRYSYGEIIEIERPSPHREDPPCPHFGTCGGCTLQHLNYSKQLEIKENHLLQVLTRIGGIDPSSLEVMPIITSPDRYFNRNKLELAFGGAGQTVALGLRERVSPWANYEGRVTSLKECLIFSEVAEKIIPLFVQFSAQHHLVPFDPIKKSGLLRHLVLKEAKSTGEIMVILETATGILPELADLWHTLSKSVPQVTSFYRAMNNQAVDTGLYEHEKLVFGKAWIEESLEHLGLNFRIYPQSFFQPNTGAAEALYRTIADIAQPDSKDRVLGLYCGMGPIEMCLSSMVKEVIGVDSNPKNIMNARENCKLNNISNITFVEDRVERLKDRLPKKPDILVIDPPRGGISKEGLNIILDAKPKKVVYVSCNPSTLARDLRYLKRHGYRPRKVAPVDAFPHTSHLESVTLLTGAAL